MLVRKSCAAKGLVAVDMCRLHRHAVLQKKLNAADPASCQTEAWWIPSKSPQKAIWSCDCS
jgi:hypothetical protein